MTILCGSEFTTAAKRGVPRNPFNKGTPLAESEVDRLKSALASVLKDDMWRHVLSERG